jgi:HlyD family secretion protein
MMVAVLALTSMVGGFFAFRYAFGGPKHYEGLTSDVTFDYFKVTIVEKGALESTNNNDIYSKVKASNKGSSSIKIDWVIEDGTIVTPEMMADPEKNILVKLDASPLLDERAAQAIKVEQARGDKIQAEKEYLITESQNMSDLLIADNTHELAKISVNKYLEGDLRVKEKQIESRYKISQSDYDLWVDRFNWSQRMFIKGYVSKSQMQSDWAKVFSLDLDKQTAQLELDVLKNYERSEKEIELKGKLKEAELALTRADIQAEAKLVQAEAKMNAQKSIYEREKGILDEMDGEIAKCIIRAPRAGLVVYYVSQQSRFNRGSSQNLVLPGEPVTFNQKMMQIPDLTKMQVRAPIHEAMVSYLRNTGGQKQKAWIRVEAFSDRAPYVGYVETVATIASQAEFFSSDVKVYDTVIVIDQEVQDLRPGMSAEVTILAYQSPEKVMSIPLQSVIGSITSGKNRKCFVVDENGYAHERDIVLGLSNETHVVVISGLNKGEKVALDPASLLPPDSDMRPTQIKAKQNSSQEEEGAPLPSDMGSDPAKKAPNGKGDVVKKGKQNGGKVKPFDKTTMLKTLKEATPEKQRELVQKMRDENPEIWTEMEPQLKKEGIEVSAD